MNEERQEPIVGRAPYERERVSIRVDDDPARPWKQAGRSWASQARRLDTYYRTQGTVGDKAKSLLGVHGHPDAALLRGRALAASKTARRLDRLTATGWVVLHDRRLASTEDTLDHVAIGPDGITVVQSIDPAGKPPAGVPVASSVHSARVQLHRMVPLISDAVSSHLGPGWTTIIYVVIAVNGSTVAVDDPPQVYGYRALPDAIEKHPRTFSRMQVTDLAMSVEPVFPFAETGDEPR
jgi:hypothetical protein